MHALDSHSVPAASHSVGYAHVRVSVCLSVSVSVPASVHVSVPVPVHVSVSVAMPVSARRLPQLCVPLSLSLSLSLSLLEPLSARTGLARS